MVRLMQNQAIANARNHKHSMTKLNSVLAACTLSCLAAYTTQAAYITIDDSDPNNMTVSAGDFENGLSINGSLFTSGLGVGNSQVFPDGGLNISGSWIDLGQSSGTVHLFFADAADPTAVTSGVELTATTDGFYGNLFGSTGGYTGVPYFPTAEPTYSQQGGTQFGGFPYLSIAFTPEHAAVPETGSTLALLGLAVSALGVMTRRIRA